MALRHGQRGDAELFYVILECEPAAKDGFLQLDDNVPGLGLKLRTDDLPQFNIIE